MIYRMMYQTAIITGASSGFGESFARELAGQCERLVLVARRTEILQALAGELQKEHSGLEVLVKSCDLSQPSARAGLITELDQLPSGSTLLVNNAGLGDYGEFAHSTPERNDSMLQVNMLCLLELCRAIIPRMKEQGGAIINISSLAADLPIPDFAVYAATKAFVTSFSEALRLELRSAGIPVLAVCPGPVKTGFGDAARRTARTSGDSTFRKCFYSTIPQVVQGALRAIQKNKPRFYPSLKVRLAAAVIRNTPLCLLRLILSRRPRRVRSLPDA